MKIIFRVLAYIEAVVSYNVVAKVTDNNKSAFIEHHNNLLFIILFSTCVLYCIRLVKFTITINRIGNTYEYKKQTSLTNLFPSQSS